MKFNISYPVTGGQKVLEIDDEKKVAIFYGKRMGNEVPGDELGEQYKGYIFKITGGNDKDGFPMKQGILVQGRVRLLMAAGHKTYRPRRKGERKRKSVRGAIVGGDIAILALSVSKVGETPIAGLTDEKRPRRLGPKRANKIRKLFNLKKDDDVKRYVVRREIKKEGKKIRVKAPKIQRLITDVRIRRKKIRKVETLKRREITTKLKEQYVALLSSLRSKKTHEPVKVEEKKVETKDTKKTAQAPVKKGQETKGKVETKVVGKPTTQTQAPKDVKPQASQVKPAQPQAGKGQTTQATKTQKK